METICSALLARELVTVDALDAALAWQSVHGWDVPTGLLVLGSVRENAILRLLSDFHELPIGPKGKLPEPPRDVLALVTPSTMSRLNVIPYKKTSRTLHLAVAAPLSADAELELRGLTDLQLRPAVVPAIRIVEALAELGEVARPLALDEVLERVPVDAPSVQDRKQGQGAPYRRMSVSAEGLHLSKRQHAAAPFRPLTVPVHTEGPAPDSQGNWLDRISARGAASYPSTVPPSATSNVEFPPASSRASGNPWLLDVSEPPSTQRAGFDGTVPTSSAAPPRRSVRGESAGAATPLRPASTGPAPRRRDPSTFTTSPPPAQDGFRHRGPLPPRDALEFVRRADEVDVAVSIVGRFARQYLERLIVFSVEGEVAQAKLAHGLGGGLPELVLRLDDGGLLARALTGGDTTVGSLDVAPSDRLLAESLGASAPEAVASIALPLKVGGRVAFLIYGDDFDTPVSLDATTAVAEFVALASVELARLLRRSAH